MEVTLGLLADAANVSREGKLNVLGVFTNINADEFPKTHPEMTLVLSFEASPAESGQKKRLEVKMMDIDANVIGGLEGGFDVPPPKRAGERVYMQSIFTINNAVFPKEGPYTAVVLIDGRVEREIPLTLTKRGGAS